MTAPPWLFVALGGAIGALLRHLSAGWLAARLGEGFPLAILSINVFGSALMGVLVGVGAGPGLSETARAFLAIGILGGFTTFSSFSAEAVRLIDAGRYGAAAAYVGLSVGLSLGGLMLGRWFLRQWLT